MEFKNTTIPDCLSVELIEKYVNKQLTADELAVFERIIGNCELSSLALDGALLFSDDHELLKSNLTLDFTDNFINEIVESKPQPKTYTYQQLIQMFSPVKHYDPVIQQVKRSSAGLAAKLITVENSNNDSADKFLKFKFANNVEFGCFISIENNKEQEVKNYTLKTARTTFMVPTSNLKPGCYYWKLRDGSNKFHIGKFYVSKKLMP